MLVLISIAKLDEVKDVVEGGADILDVKNPFEGSLGAPSPTLLKQVCEIAPPTIEVSSAIGDLPNLPGTAALASLGAALCGVDYIKAGLKGVGDVESAAKLMREVVEAAKLYDGGVRLVAAGYADAHRVGSLNPLEVPEVARKADADVAMIDTAVKDGRKLFDFLSQDQLTKFVEDAHAHGLLAALAGSLRVEDIPRIAEIGADIVGFRGAACEGGDRARGRVSRERVLEIVKAARAL